MGTRTRGRGALGERLTYVDPAAVPEAPGRPHTSPADMLTRAAAPLGAVPPSTWDAMGSSQLMPGALPARRLVAPSPPRRLAWEGLQGQSQRPLSQVIYIVLEPAPGKYISQVMAGGLQKPLL